MRKIQQHSSPTRIKKRARRAARCPKKVSVITRKRGETVVYELFKTIQHFFPNLFEQLRAIEDCRERSDYNLCEIIMAAIAMFIFKQGSRNALNNLRYEEKFAAHYQRLFKLRLPHLDTVHRVLCHLPDHALEQLKQCLVQTLLEKKTLHKYRLFGRYFLVAIDATGTMTFSERHCEHCLHQTSKNGKTTYFHQVLEAKVITKNGFTISLATEWIANPSGEYDKQDCERKAFVRLAAKLRQLYPRLPICLVADGLYPHQGFFDCCRDNKWHYILSFQDGNLPSVWKKVQELRPLCPGQQHRKRFTQGTTSTEQMYSWVSNIDYHSHHFQWLECLETVQKTTGTKQSRFVHITDFAVSVETVRDLSASGRLRWNIENEGFNTQKNGGYKLRHKYSRVNWQAAKNYYQCLQIGHMINQLMILSTSFQGLLQQKTTICYLWHAMIAFLIFGQLEDVTLDALSRMRFQVRFVT